MNEYYWQKKKFLLFILIGITVLMIFFIHKIEFSSNQECNYQIYSIEFNWYGMNATKLEENILIPLEQKLSGVEGLLEFNSTAQYSKTITTLYFDKTSDKKENYLAIKNIVDSLYMMLPEDVQKPQIYSSEGDSKSTICIAFFSDKGLDELRENLEKELKKKLDAVDGVGQVIISGGKVKEVLVSFDNQKSSISLQTPTVLVSLIRDSNAVISSTSIKSVYQNKVINFNTKLNSIDQIKRLPIKKDLSITNLENLTDIKISERSENELVRIDGQQCVTLSIKKSSNANEIKLSNQVKKILKAYDKETNIRNYKILYDKGAEQFKMVENVMLALFESFFCVILIIPLFYKSKRTVVLIVLLLLFCSVWTVGILSVVGLKLNQYTIAGISIALGLVADSVLLISEIYEQKRKKMLFFSEIKKLIPAIIAASLTTILCLVVLFFLDNLVSGIRQIAFSILVMILCSLVLSIVFFPAYCVKDEEYELYLNTRFYTNCQNWLIKENSKKGKKYYQIKRLTYLTFAIIPIFLFIKGGKNLNLENDSEILYFSVDYQSDVDCIYIDKEILELTKRLNEQDYIRFVRTESKKGNCQVEVGLKSRKDKEKANKYIKSLDWLVSDGFLHINTLDNDNSLNIQVSVIGDESSKCREYAKKLSRRVIESGISSSVVLNFKEDGNELFFYPDRNSLIRNNLGVHELASILRWNIFGPVADKWLEEEKEYDIRIRATDYTKPTLNKVLNLIIPTQNSFLRLAGLGTVKLLPSDTKIFTRNGRRCAYFTVETQGLSCDKVLKQLREILGNEVLEKGYAFSFSSEMENMGEKYRVVLEMLFLCIIGIFLLLMALTEITSKALKIISIIPVSLALPCIFKFFSGRPFTLGDIVAAIIVSGITVNNAIYIEESDEVDFSSKLKSKLKSIFVTSITTIVGAVPLFLLSSDGFNKDLSLFMTLGIFNSLFVTIYLYEAINNIGGKK